MDDIKKTTPFCIKPAFAFILLPALAFLFNWPYLKGRFALDDIVIYNAFSQTPLRFPLWKGVWTGFDHSVFRSYWWVDPDTSAAFWRPIPSLLIEASMYLFNRNAFPLHFLSILLHGGIAVGLYLLVKKLTGHNILALVSGLFFVACEDFTMTVGWISTITDLFCVLFILISLIAHIDWLRGRNPWAMIVSIAALILALGCKETAVIAPVAILLTNLFMPDGVDENDFNWKKLGQRTAKMFRDTLSWLPSVVVLALYLAIYKTFFLGALKSLLYNNPFDDPVGYISQLVLQLPVFWLGTFSPALINLPLFFPDLTKPLSIAGVVVFTAWIIAFLPFRKHSLALWAFILYIIALLPQVCTDASSRGLYFPGIPGNILIAMVALTIGPIAGRMGQEAEIKSRWTRFMGWMAIFGILIPGILLSIAMPFSFLPALEKPEKDFSTAILDIEGQGYDHVVFLNASEFLLSIYASEYMAYLLDDPPDISLLSAAYGVFSLERTGETSFIIRTDRKGWLSNFVARALRTEPMMRVGRTYERGIFNATIVETTEDSRDALAVEFDFKIPLDDPGLLFLRWNGDSFEPLDISNLEVGETTELADTSDMSV
ncbi:MAG: glycosyltransferase family 39 protein [bacterium]|nr:glycosyltransferase family 39 protein [bacterium]